MRSSLYARMQPELHFSVSHGTSRMCFTLHADLSARMHPAASVCYSHRAFARIGVLANSDSLTGMRLSLHAGMHTSMRGALQLPSHKAGALSHLYPSVHARM